MKTRAICTLLCLCMAASLISTPCLAADATTERIEYAESLAYELKALNLFQGVGTNANGSTNFDLNRAPTRIEALVMLIRVLGKENEAEMGQWEHPFLDIPDWADCYIGYAYQKGLTNGVSDTLFGADDTAASYVYLTFMLRALGYSDKNSTDFSWNTPFALAQAVGISPEAMNTDDFLRADAVIVSHAAMSAKVKGSSTTLLEQLVSMGAVDQESANEFVAGTIQPSLGVVCYEKYKDIPDYGIHNESNIEDILTFDSGFVYLVNKADDDCKICYIDLLRELDFDFVTDLASVSGSTQYSNEYRNPVTGTEVYICRDYLSLSNNKGSYNVIYISIGKNVTQEMLNTVASYNSNDSGTPDGGGGQIGIISMYSAFPDVPDYATATGDKVTHDRGSVKIYSSSSASVYISVLESYGFTKSRTYTEKYEDSILTTQFGNVSVYKNTTCFR